MPTKTIRPTLMLLLATTAAPFWLSGRVLAQDSGSTAGPLGTIILEVGGEEDADGPVMGDVAKTSGSAGKIAQPLGETPVSVSVVTAEQIADHGATSVAEALNYTAGAFGSYRGTSNVADEIQVRGFGDRTAVSKFVDGLKLGQDNFGQIDPYYFERIELVKGPGSVAYGQVPPGGLINMVSKRPTAGQGNELGFSIGTDAYARIDADLQGDLGESGALSYRLVMSGWQKNLQGDFDQNRLLLAPSLTWKISDTTELTVTALHQREPDAGQRGFFPRLGTLEATPGGTWIDPGFVSYAPDYDYIDRTTDLLGYELTHEMGNGWTLNQKFRYGRIDMDHSQAGLWDWTPNGDGTYPLYFFRDQQSERQIALDTSISGEWATGALTHKLAFGVDVLKSDYADDFARTGAVYDYSFETNNSPSNALILATPMTAYVSHTERDLKQAGVYLQDNMEWNNWLITAGARYDWTRTDITEDYVAPWGAGTDVGLYKDEALSGRLAVSYKFANGLVPYLSYSTSFEPVTQLDDDGNASFKPYQARQWELGAKWSLAQGRVLLTGALFDIRKKNLLESVTVAGVTTTEQVGAVRSKGIELEAHAELSDRMSLIASYFKADAYYETGDNAGNQYPAVPLESAALWVKYGISDGIDASLGLRYTGPSWSSAANTSKVPGYTLADLGVSVDLGVINPAYDGMKALLSVQNVTDERYVSSCVRDYCWLGEGRSMTASLNYAW